MRRLILAVLLVTASVAVIPSSASAATCSDYPNQAAAQRAADTRDADGDGIYCESLPCPCTTGGGGGGSTGGGGSPNPKPKPKPKPRKRAQRIAARITSVVDGDTVKVKAFGAKRSFYTVRLIGIDTPETKRPGRGVECGGRRATAAMYRLAFPGAFDSDGDGLEDDADGLGRQVTLVTDPTQDTFDRYGRLLAYVTTRAGRSLQTEMLRRGWAKVYVYGGNPFNRYERFRRAQSRAANAGRGVWGRCGGNFHATTSAVTAADDVPHGVVASARAVVKYCKYFERGGDIPRKVQERAFFGEAHLRDRIRAGDRKARRRVREIHRNHPTCPLNLIPRSVLR